MLVRWREGGPTRDTQRLLAAAIERLKRVVGLVDKMVVTPLIATLRRQAKSKSKGAELLLTKITN